MFLPRQVLLLAKPSSIPDQTFLFQEAQLGDSAPEKPALLLTNHSAGIRCASCQTL